MNLEAPTLFVLGMPLDEDAEISSAAKQALAKARLVVGESRKVAYRFLKQAGDTKEKIVFLLDPPREDNLRELRAQLALCRDHGEHAALFSDTGIPILYDPGREVLEWAKELGFCIRSVPGPTSWGTAAALSGFEPPFLLVGFLPRGADERARVLRDFARELTRHQGHLVLMDTPYRFRVLLEGCREALGPKREAFLAWEIAKPGEKLLWGNLGSLEKIAEAHSLQKGEFILILKSK